MTRISGKHKLADEAVLVGLIPVSSDSLQFGFNGAGSTAFLAITAGAGRPLVFIECRLAEGSIYDFSRGRCSCVFIFFIGSLYIMELKKNAPTHIRLEVFQ